MRSPSFRGAVLATTTLLATLGRADADPTPRTPIQHLIVVVGENVSFDTLFATYTPPDPSQTIRNLLSEHIIKADGSPGSLYHLARQNIAHLPAGLYTIAPGRVRPYLQLPQPLQTGELDPTTFTTASGTPDLRYGPGLRPGPYQITNGKVAYAASFAAETGDPVHRFYQMWEQTGGSNMVHDLFTWVAVTTGTGGANGASGPTPSNAQQGGELMGFFNMATGDAAYFKSLADTYALADNYHQGVMGGTGMNFFMLATGDMPYYTLRGQPATPPAAQIENPNPVAGTPNFYTNDGYSGGSYSRCADPSEPGVGPILSYLLTLGRASKCAPHHYYLLNNYAMPFDTYGNATLDANNNPVVVNGTPVTNAFTLPPQTVPTIGEAMSAAGVSWKWYTGGRTDADVVNDPFYQSLRPKFPSDAAAIATVRPLLYNSIGDPLNASANVVQGPLRANLQGITDFYADITAGTLPAVSFVIPKNLDSGHPGYSASAKYELFIKDLLQRVEASAQWPSTAVVVTTDEGGGYFDTGPDQTLDFFGDGSRIPTLVISPYARHGFVDHTYYDHVSVLKFIERNWNIPPLSARSRDRLPNPLPSDPETYLPANAPAIGNLMNLFDFGHR